MVFHSRCSEAGRATIIVSPLEPTSNVAVDTYIFSAQQHTCTPWDTCPYLC